MAKKSQLNKAVPSSHCLPGGREEGREMINASKDKSTLYFQSTLPRLRAGIITESSGNPATDYIQLRNEAHKVKGRFSVLLKLLQGND